MSRWHLQLCVKHAVHFQHGERAWRPRKNERVNFPPRKTRHVRFWCPRVDRNGAVFEEGNLVKVIDLEGETRTGGVRCIQKSSSAVVRLHQMRQDTTSDKIKDYQVYPEEQQCSCTCLQLMKPDKIPQDTGVSDETLQSNTSDRIKEFQVYPEEQQRSCSCLQLMRPDKIPQDTGVSEQQCSCTCLHQMRPDKTPQVTEVSDDIVDDPETRL
ncbi:hypothetical protein Bbelb_151230 [Branchiostoma belcheri]|nr:hypothetical protein Bbelb_151230 [Branchiostoma belcheri]